MTELLALVERVLSVLSNLLGITSLIHANQTQQAQQSTLLAVATDVAIIRGIVASPQYGLAALSTELSQTAYQVGSLYGTAQRSGQPVTLPPAFPPAWNAGLGSAAGAGVWAVDVDGLGNTAGDYQSWAAQFASALSHVANLVDDTVSQFWINGPFTGFGFGPVPTANPAGDVSHILSTDTLLTWLNRENPGWTFRLPTPNSGYAAALAPSAPAWVYTCRISETQFAGVQGAMFPGPTERFTAPAWPGLAYVTLATPVAIAPPEQTVNGPMDGVIVAITGVPTPVGYYQFGPNKSFVKLGGVTFESDNGNDEYAQSVTFESGVIVPHSMARAARAQFRFKTGTTGTITPWTIV